MIKRVVVVVTVWAIALAWVLTSVVHPAASASASAAVPAAAPIRHHKTARLCSATVKTRHATCFAIRQTDTVQPAGMIPNAVSPNFTPDGFGPSTLAAAYKLDQTQGGGQTVAIVDAYDDPNAEADLALYRAQFHLSACTTANGCFRKVNEFGSAGSLPVTDTGWAGEISLDLDMVSATCPNCHILLVEANSASNVDLGTAVNQAVTLGAKFVSNSYGGPEYTSESTDDAAYYDHPGVAITASAGDLDYGAMYPATGANVTAVGGTSLVAATNARGWDETVWNAGITPNGPLGTGSGCSAYITRPSFQTSLTTGCSKRAEADVAAVADPSTGMTVYDTYLGGWQVFGGTSAASPIIASVYALAGTPLPLSSPNSYPYAHVSNLFDVTGGSNDANSTCASAVLCKAGPGWDGPTGLGTPNGTGAFGVARGFTGRTPVRVLDTRKGVGAPAAKLGAGRSLTLTVPGLPAGATAVALNVTVAGPSAASYLTVYPGGTSRSLASNLNYLAGQSVPNMVMVPLGAGHTVTFYNSAGTVNVIADLVGSYAPGTGAGFTGITPVRVLDTRLGVGAPMAKLGVGPTLTLTVPGLPAGATAVALNVTVTGPTAPSAFLTVYPGGTLRPLASNLNYLAGQTVPNMVLVPVGPGNTVTFYNSAGTVNVIADLVGSYAPGTGSGFIGRTPVRVLDTRTGVGAPVATLGAGRTLTLTVTGLAGGATAVALNVTVTNPTARSFLTVYPGGRSRPLASNLNYVAGQTVPNMVLVPVGPGNTVTFYNSGGTVNVIADVDGYFG